MDNDLLRLSRRVKEAESASFSKSGGTVTGAIVSDGAAGMDKEIAFSTSGASRFKLGVNKAAENGSNSGSNFQISRYADDGSYLDAPVSINRQSGEVAVNGRTMSQTTKCVMTDEPNLNNLTEGGIYRLDSVSNGFPGANWSNMLVVRGGHDTIAQMGFPYNADEIYFRRGTTSSFTGNTWKRLWHNENMIYDFGPWTPRLYGETAAGNPTYASRYGRYVRIGNIVHVSGMVYITSKGGMTGAIRIADLPFRAGSSSAGSIGAKQMVWGNDLPHLQIDGSVNYLLLISQNTYITDQQIGDGFALWGFGITYPLF